MTEQQTATSPSNGSRTEPLDLSREPLRIAPNEREKWIDFGNGGKSFHDAAEIILDAAKKDGERTDLGIASLNTWAFGPGPDGVASLATLPAPGRERRMVPLREHAFSQVCSRVGAPAAYIRKLPAKLQMACVNHGIQHDGSEHGNLLRMADGEARALVSDRYAALDNHIILEVLDKTLRAAGLLGEVRVRSVAVGPTLSLRMTFPGHDAIVKSSPQINDVVEVGLDLLNGEVGNRAVSICPLVYRLICLNGMRRADREVAQRLRHVGDPARMEEAFRDAVPSALAASQGLRERMVQSVDRLIDDVLGEFDVLRTFGLTANDSRDVARDVMAQRSLALPEKTDNWADVLASVNDLSAYDVLNGVTHVAQRRGTDSRLEMEEAASRYLYSRTRS